MQITTYNYVCRSLRGNRDSTVVKLWGYRLGTRVLFLAEALVFFFTLFRVRHSTDLIVHHHLMWLRTHLLAAVYKVTDVSYFSYIFSKTSSEICRITVGQMWYEFKSTNLISWLLQTWSINVERNAVECGRSVSLEKSNWQIQNCFWYAGLSHEQLYSWMKAGFSFKMWFDNRENCLEK